LNVVLAAALLALAGCGGGGNGDLASTVAKAVPPPPLTTSTAVDERQEVPASHAVEPEAGQSGPAVNTTQPDAEQVTGGSSQTVRLRATTARGRLLSGADRASFERLSASLGGQSGLAVSGLGRGRRVERVGPLQSAVAWSTAKIPVAMAVIATGAGSSQQGDLASAITASDNAAALRLWASLGGGQAAAEAAGEQLREAGDASTQIESRALRGAGYTPFGQTAWSLSDQARFAAGMTCTEAGKQVLGLMENVVAGQRWGLGSAGVAAKFKGGWGPGSQPGADGGYLDRQMGVLNIGDKQLAVAIATQPADGSHETGTRNLTMLARWLVAHVDVRRLPSQPTC
jgi:beta-lactamase class A